MNMWAMNVTLEVSKLSGWLNADAYCRESKGMRCGVRYAGRQARETAGDGGAGSVQERARLQIGGRARGGAHPEHVAHSCNTLTPCRPPERTLTALGLRIGWRCSARQGGAGYLGQLQQSLKQS